MKQPDRDKPVIDGFELQLFASTRRPSTVCGKPSTFHKKPRQVSLFDLPLHMMMNQDLHRYEARKFESL